MADFNEFMKEFQRQFLEKAKELYSNEVIKHFLHPRNPGSMDDPDGHARIRGPCGDTMEIFIRVRNDKIINASFQTDGCMTTVVSASMAVELATDKDVKDAQRISKEDILKSLGGLPEESQHCALLASNTLRAAISDYLFGKKEPWKKLYRPASRK